MQKVNENKIVWEILAITIHPITLFWTITFHSSPDCLSLLYGRVIKASLTTVTCFLASLCHLLMCPLLLCHRPNSGVPACMLSEKSCCALVFKQHSTMTLWIHPHYLPGLIPQGSLVKLKRLIIKFLCVQHLIPSQPRCDRHNLVKMLFSHPF